MKMRNTIGYISHGSCDELVEENLFHFAVQ